MPSRPIGFVEEMFEYVFAMDVFHGLEEVIFLRFQEACQSSSSAYYPDIIKIIIIAADNELRDVAICNKIAIIRRKGPVSSVAICNSLCKLQHHLILPRC